MIKTITYKNTPLSYYACGKGFSVVLLHGFAETYAIWKNQSGFLKNYYRLIIPDLPGSGASALFETGKNNLTIDELADSIHSIIINENIERCIMLGHSMGGYVTLSYAEKYAHKLQAFGLVHSTAFADSEEKKQIRKRGIEIMETYGGYAFLKTTTPNLFTTGFKKKHNEIVKELIEEGRHFKKENLQQYYYAMMNRADKTSVLKNTVLPVLFVAGTEDAAAPLNDVLKQVHAPEIAYIHIINNMAHQSLLEVPVELNSVLKNFIDEAA
ncbi:alpha/beta fold hydrolase [Parafilimonas terrae]|uniref:Pimeloyl-ACP methyl ester carboxylesterase n=1 Tax=Parafilimonas terrae TaxID=1465490 RepID=A0A1I5YA71_9BACT|nr:alpha/beta hydrolase [Parafilimonas terrae]SFQ41142.1 Pimeloyl-ACP methyl ester carboxylesterase [Parafilimonas terrae]